METTIEVMKFWYMEQFFILIKTYLHSSYSVIKITSAKRRLILFHDIHEYAADIMRCGYL